MTQSHPDESYDPEAVADYRQEARAFLVKAREYLAAGDLHQASEKGWGAAAWMAKAVAEVYGWQYREHQQFGHVLNRASEMSGKDRIFELKSIAYGLHSNYYTRKRFLSGRAIAHDLDRMAELLEALEPLTVPGGGAAGG